MFSTSTSFDINCDLDFDFQNHSNNLNKITLFQKKKYFKIIVQKIKDNKIYEQIHKENFQIKQYSNIIYAEFVPFQETSYFLDLSNKIDNLDVEIEISRKPFKSKKNQKIQYKLSISPLYHANLKTFENNYPIIFLYQEVNININNDINYFYRFMKTIINKMKELKFNNLYNRFTTTLEEKKINLESQIFENFYDKDDCCICMEKTTCKTICEHNLCLKCYGSLIKKSNLNVTCPICRKSFKNELISSLEDDEFDDDEDFSLEDFPIQDSTF